jgi:type II secretory pathway predicted ATPase ExeA/outer membrane protein OmpA-like peptidoglycan-associated protein
LQQLYWSAMQGYPAESSVQVQLLSHFGLAENPFGVTPDPRFLFLGQTHQEALASLIIGIDCGFGFQALVAQPGMGKTTLLFNLLEKFRTTAHTAFLFQPGLKPYQLLQAVLFELGANSEETSLHKLSEQLNQVLGRAAQERKRVIVVVDEAQHLESAVLEALRQLSNFETTHSKLMQIILAGQPQLVKNLASPEQQQLRQRISAIGRLSPLGLDETRAYIHHRLRTAGYIGVDLFTDEAVRKIWNHSNGIPRNINTLCFGAMLLALAKGAKSVDENLLEEAARDLDLNRVLADLYSPLPMPLSAGEGKLQLIREPESPDLDNTRPRMTKEPLATPLGMPGEAAAIAPVAHSVDRNLVGDPENIPALTEVIARISQAPDKQKVLSTPESIPADREPAASLMAAWASTIPSNSGNPLPTQAPDRIEDNPAVAIPRESTAKLAITPLKTSQKAGQSKPRPAAGTAPFRPGTLSVGPRYISKAPAAVQSSRQFLRKRPEHGSWPKALCLAAATGILALVIVRGFPLHPGPVGQIASGVSAPQQGDSPMDTPNARQSARADSRAPGNASSSESAKVIVRRSPVSANIGPDASDQGRKLESIFFDEDSDMIGSRYRRSLREIADALAENPKASAILEGHTDSSGPESYNLDLSSRRAVAVRNALVNDLHVSGAQLKAIGVGSAAPVQSNSTAAGRAYNRRVEVRVWNTFRADEARRDAL